MSAVGHVGKKFFGVFVGIWHLSNRSVKQVTALFSLLGLQRLRSGQ